MALGITLILLAIIGITLGIIKKNKILLTTSVILLIFIAISWAVYQYLYSLNPY